MLSRFIPVGILFFILLTGNAQPGHLNAIDIFSADANSTVACYRIPAIAVLSDGSILAAADERKSSCADLRSNRDINIVIRKFTEGVRTGSAVQTIVDYPEGRSASDPSFIMDIETGVLFLFYNYMDLDNAPGIYRFHVVRTSNAGLSWSAPEDITQQITPSLGGAKFRFITSGSGVQLSDGRLLHTMVNVESGSVQLFGSQDHGRSWRLFGKPAKPADESRVAELPDGRWMVNARVNKAGLRFIHETSDEGTTWISRPEPALPDPGCNAGLIRVRGNNGRDVLLFTNPNSADTRRKLTLKESYDGGKNWKIVKKLYSGSSAYSVLEITSQSKLAILFERDDYRAISLILLSRRQWMDSAEMDSQ